MGGRDGLFASTVEAYNPRTNTWRSCLSLGQGRSGAVAGVVGGRLVVAGGYGGGGPGGGVDLTSVEAYTPTGWTPLPPLPHGAWLATACVLDGRLYVMGGDGCNKLQVLEMSEENEFTWAVKADLPAARYDAASAVHEGKLWLIGGRGCAGAATSVVIYDTSNDTWTQGPALPQQFPSPMAAVLDGEIHLCARDAHLVLRHGIWTGAAHLSTHSHGACRSIVLG